MYGLSGDIRLDFLKGNRLTGVDANEFQVQVRLGSDVEISSESSISIDGHPVSLNDVQRFLQPILGAVVSEVSVEGRGDLVMIFDRGVRLVFHDASDDYESYSITWSGGTIVV